MSKEELKRMEDFVNATLKPDKPNEYRLGYEDALRRCYYFVDNLQQENKQLKELCDKYEKEHNKEFNIWLQGQKVLKDLEEWLNYQFKHTLQQNNYYSVLDKIQELKEKYK